MAKALEKVKKTATRCTTNVQIFAENAVASCEANKSQMDAHSIMVLEDDQLRLKDAFKEFTGAINALIEADDEKELASHQETLATVNRTFWDANQLLLNTMQLYKPASQSGLGLSTPGPGRQFRIDESLRPDRLSLDQSPSELRIWLRRFRSYFRKNHMETIYPRPT